MLFRQNKYILILLVPIILGFIFNEAEARYLTSPLRKLPLIINSYFDHSKPGYSGRTPIIDNSIPIYTGEIGTRTNEVCGSIGNIFAYFTKPNKSGKCVWYDGHNGIDFRAAKGDDVLSAAPGIIQSATFDNCNGLITRIWHSNLGYSTLYVHLDKFSKISGNVKRSEVIAKSGDSGNCTTGPHLHFGVRNAKIGGQVMDPYGWSGTTTDPWPYNKGYLWTTNPPSLKPPATYVSGFITKDTTWTKDKSPYVVDGAVIVNKGATLTINPGVVVKLKQQPNFPGEILVYGNLIAKGTAKDKIYFTSIADDSVGGDTNGDGNKTKPAPGDYKDINFFANSTGFFDNSIIKYGGKSKYDFPECLLGENCVLKVKGGNVTIKNSEISENFNGIYVTDKGTLTVDSSVILDNSRVGIDVYAGFLALSHIYNITVTNTAFGGHRYMDINFSSTKLNFVNYGNRVAKGSSARGIWMTKTEFSVDQIWNPGIPFVIGSFSPYVSKGKTLTISPGTIVKFDNKFPKLTPFRIFGNLNAKGTPLNKIYFTSIADDSVGGDTNGDGNKSSPTPGDFCGISFLRGSRGIFHNTILRYGGGSGYYYCVGNIAGKSGIIVNGGGNVDIKNTSINDSYSDGINSYGGTTAILLSSIYNNKRYGIYNAISKTINAANNYWGDPSGPYHPKLNPNGKGDRVSDNVNFKPWLKYPYPVNVPSSNICQGC